VDNSHSIWIFNWKNTLFTN